MHPFCVGMLYIEEYKSTFTKKIVFCCIRKKFITTADLNICGRRSVANLTIIADKRCTAMYVYSYINETSCASLSR